MHRRVFIAALGAPLIGNTQQAGRVYRIGALGGPRPSAEPDDDSRRLREVFTQAMRERGYVEGANLIIERRYLEGGGDRLPGLASELAGLGLDVIVAASYPAARAMKEATTTTPIVMLLVSDPVGAGLVASLARPGGNLTGLSDYQEDLTLKRLELLKTAVPRAERVAILSTKVATFDATPLDVLVAARAMGVTLFRVDIQAPEDFASAAAAIVRERPDALFLDHRPVIFILRREIAQFAAAHSLPTMASLREHAAAGMLMSYGTSTAGQLRTVAGYVDKILKGAKPGDLPIEQPTTFELIINLKTAKALGLTIPQSLLVRADEVIQ